MSLLKLKFLSFSQFLGVFIRRGGFQTYVDALKSLLESEPNVITYVMDKSSVNEIRAKKILAVAAMKGHIKETKLGGKSKYAITDEGIRLTKEYKPFEDFSERLEDAFKKSVIK